MKEPGLLGNKYFYFSFSVSFLILSLCFLLMTNSVHPQNNYPSLRETQTDSEIYLPTTEDAMAVLFIGSENGSTTAGTFILARFDPARGSVPIIVFPPQTVVQNGNSTETLTQAFQYGGAETAKSALAGTLGVDIDRYVHMSTDIFVACANTVGNIEFDLPMDLPVEQNGVHVILSAGKQLLDGKKVSDLMGYQGYEDGELMRCQIAGALTAEIVNQRIDIVESTLLDKVFEKIINLIDTDISYLDFEVRKEAAKYLAQTDNPALSVHVSGSFSQDQKEFHLSDTFVALLRQTLS